MSLFPLYQLLLETITVLLESDPDNLFMLTGDFNGLSTTYLHSQLRMHQSVNAPTHNNNMLDVLLAMVQTCFAFMLDSRSLRSSTQH